MAALTKAALLALAAASLPRETLEIPELGGTVTVQGMSGKQRDAWEKSLIVGRGKRRDVNTENVRAKLACVCLIDEQGQRLFTDEDADALGELRVDVLSRIFEVAQRLSGVSDSDLDELGKASAPAAGTDSPTS